MTKIKKLMLGSLIFFAGVYVLFCGVIYFFQGLFFYNPYSERADIETVRRYGYVGEEVEYKSADGTELFGWISTPKEKHKMVVFLHGNSYSIEEFFYKAVPFYEAGYGFFLPEYRGFGGVKGKISQKNLAEDSIASVKYLHSLGYKNEDIILYGMSLGSYMAINTIYHLKNEGKFAGLVLEVPFDNLSNVVKSVVPLPLPFSLIVKDKYDNLDMISKVDTRVLVMGGTKDTTVPVSLAENLYNHAVDPKKLIIYKGGKHSNLFNYQNNKDVLNWLEEK